jgi:hypothetical protein
METIHLIPPALTDIIIKQKHIVGKIFCYLKDKYVTPPRYLTMMAYTRCGGKAPHILDE